VVRVELANRLNRDETDGFLVIPAAMSFFAFGDTLLDCCISRDSLGRHAYVWALLICQELMVASTPALCSSVLCFVTPHAYAFDPTRSDYRSRVCPVSDSAFDLIELGLAVQSA